MYLHLYFFNYIYIVVYTAPNHTYTQPNIHTSKHTLSERR